MRQKVAPAAKKRGADAHVPSKSRAHRRSTEDERRLEQGLEESMAGSDPPSITQPQQNRNFEKPLGSSHTDEADMREVAKEARRKSK
jgi:hypothetical protein